MTYRRFVVSTVAASLMFAQAAPALAASTAEILATQKDYLDSSFCDDKEGDSRGSCISDVIKRMKTLRDDFKDALEEERTAWKLANGRLGVTAEYRAALTAYLKSVADLRRTFAAQEREVLSIFFAKQKEALRAQKTATPTRRRHTQVLNKSATAAAAEKCARQTDRAAKRLCIRLNLRINDPEAKAMGAAVRRSRAD